MAKGKRAATVNGKPVELNDGETVLSMFRRVDPAMPIVVIRLNGRILSKGEWSTPLRDGDEMAVIDMIAGG